MKVKTFILILALIWASVLGHGEAAASFDHSTFDQILKKYVNDKGLVDYNGVAGDPAFKTYMDSLESAKPEEMSRDGMMAFWINAYNAVTIDKVIKWKPKKSVRETLIPGVWTSTKFFTSREHTVAGKRLSQDDIEHEILRKQFKDPRIHFTIICASSSCPPLSRIAFTHEILRKQFKDPRIHFTIICASSSCPPLSRIAFTEENLQPRMEEETRKYINSLRGTKTDYAENTLYLSKLFDWFAGDFESKSGSIMNFIKPYLNQQALEFLDRNPKISYIHYDWSLNAQGSLK
jgi:hypothetical protein